MAAQKIISGIQREVWQEVTPQDNGSQTFVTKIRIGPGQLARVHGLLIPYVSAGVPVLTATPSVDSTGYLRVTVTNTAPPGNTATWRLDIQLEHSFHQVNTNEAGVIMVVPAAQAGTPSSSGWQLINEGTFNVTSSVVGGAQIATLATDILSGPMNARRCYLVECHFDDSSSSVGEKLVRLVLTGAPLGDSVHMRASSPAVAYGTSGQNLGSIIDGTQMHMRGIMWPRRNTDWDVTLGETVCTTDIPSSGYVPDGRLVMGQFAFKTYPMPSAVGLEAKGALADGTFDMIGRFQVLWNPALSF